jgi:hypothetical protein
MKLKNLLITLITGTLLMTSVSFSSPLDKFSNKKTNTTQKQVIKVNLPFNYMFFLVPKSSYTTSNININTPSLDWLGVFLFNNMRKKPTHQYIYSYVSL